MVSKIEHIFKKENYFDVFLAILPHARRRQKAAQHKIKRKPDEVR